VTVETAVPRRSKGWWRRNRAVASLAVALLLVLGLLGVLTTGGKAGTLDPDAYDPAGAHALAVLLADNGITVHRTTDLPATQQRAGAETVVFVPLPELLSGDELNGLKDLPGELVVAGAGPTALGVFGPRLSTLERIDVDEREPGCRFEPARRAGSAEVGGLVYRGEAQRCYAGTLVRDDVERLVLVGAADFMTNDRLDESGNAALALGLLGRGESVVWLVPDPARADVGTRPVTDPNELLPTWVGAAALQLAIALFVLALWRARRFGRVVPEPLPVVVRAAEAVEGRGRLYQAARARETASDQLRAGARHRLGTRVGAGRNPSLDALVAGVVGQTDGSTEEVTTLLYGPEPADDAALVRLADDLDALTREVTST